VFLIPYFKKSPEKNWKARSVYKVVVYKRIHPIPRCCRLRNQFPPRNQFHQLRNSGNSVQSQFLGIPESELRRLTRHIWSSTQWLNSATEFPKLSQDGIGRNF
jgi:hypothetical protein